MDNQQQPLDPAYEQAQKELAREQSQPVQQLPDSPQTISQQEQQKQQQAKPKTQHKGKQQIADDAATEQGEQKPLQFGDYAEDALEGVGAGAEGFVRSLGKLGNDIAGAFGHKFTDDPHAFDNQYFHARTWAGSITSGITQFALGFIPALGVAGKIGGAIGLAGKLGTVAEGLAAGAAADFAGFKEDNQRLSNLIQQVPALRNPVTDYLSAKPGDSWAEGRLKNSLEGMGLGAITDLALHSIRGFKLKAEAVKAGDPAAYAKAADETADKVAKAMPKDSVESIDAAGTTTPGKTADDFKGGKSPDFTAASISPEDFATKLKSRIDSYGLDPVDAADDAAKTWVNMDRLDLGKGSKSFMDWMTKLGDTLTQKNIGGQKTLAGATQMAKDWFDEIGVGSKFVAWLNRDASNIEGIYGRMIAYRIGRNSVLDHMQKLATQIGGATADDAAELYKQFDQAKDLFVNIHKQVQKIQTEGARIPSFQRVVTGAGKIDWDGMADSVGDVILGHQGKEAQTKLVKALAAADGDAKGVMNVFRGIQSMGGKFLSVHNELWINGLLSGNATATKLLSDTFNTVLKPAERILGGAVTMNPGMVRSGFSLYMNIVRSAFDVFKFGDITGKVNELAGGSTVGTAARSLMDEQHLFEGAGRQYGAISTQNLNMDSSSVFGQAVNWMGKFVRIPQRLLGTTDTFFKNLNYRAYIYEEADRLAREAGISDGQQYEQFISDHFAKQFGKGGAFTNKNAIEYAGDATFSKELLPGTIGRTVQEAVGNHPTLKLIFPFVQTPTNIFRRFVQYTPGINMLQGEFQKALTSPNTVVRADAKGRMAMGGLLWTGAIGLTASGKVTGGGPSNPQEKNALLDTGWRPYSIVLTGDDGKKSYVDYRKLEPYAYFLGLAADFHDAGAMMHDDDQGGMATAMTYALAHNLSSKTYFTGLTEMINALSQPDKNAQRWLDQRAGSYVPAGLAKSDNDDYMRDARTIMDSMMRRLPGFSKDLPPVRDMFGDPVRVPGGYLPFGAAGTEGARMLSPAAFSQQVDDPTRQEIAKLQYGFTKAPKSYQGFPLQSFVNPQTKQDAYDRFQELHGQVTIGGQKMSEALSNLINSDRYKSMPDPEGHGDQSNPRVMAVQKVIADYRQKAMGQTLQEYPAIKRAVQMYQAQARTERTQ